MPNPTGRNGNDNGTCPPDEVLKKALHGYARKGYSLADRLDWLRKDFGYQIKDRKLRQLNAKFEVPTVKKPPPLPIATSIVTQYAAENLTSRNGPATIQKKIAQLEGILIPRDTVRQIMLSNDPDGFDIRDPSAKRASRRKGHLKGSGVFQEIHCDGHEKLSSKALQLGSVGIEIYGMKCHSSGLVIFEQVVEITVDGGNETGQMRACHIALRQIYTPELPFEQAPASVALKSSDNVPVESSWDNMRNYNGRDLRAAILITKDTDKKYFNPMDSLHVHLFNWIWPKIAQKSVLEFKEYWNNHRPRHQHEKLLPSGEHPIKVFNFPENYGLKHCGVKVDMEVVQYLRGTLAKTREECFRWVSDEFDEQAQAIYKELGCPECILLHAFCAQRHELNKVLFQLC